MEWLKMMHVSCVMISFAYFLLRGYWMYRASPYLQQKLWARYLPDTVDTVLLGSGVAMMFQFGIYPHEQSWLGVKILALFAYIGLGSVALYHGKSKTIRLRYYVAAVVVFVYMLALAVSKAVWPLPI